MQKLMPKVDSFFRIERCRQRPVFHTLTERRDELLGKHLGRSGSPRWEGLASTRSHQEKSANLDL
jgi:hypothetical protein